MNHWRLLDRIYTTKALMTPRESLLVWDGEDRDQLPSIWQRADELKVDTIPIVRGGQIRTFILRGITDEQQITFEWAITQDTGILELIRTFSQQQKRCLFVTAGQQIVGIVTPADLNRLPARTYFYSLIAELEITLLAEIEKYDLPDKEILTLSNCDSEREEQITGVIDNSEFELEIIHALNLSELVNIVRKHDSLRHRLHFKSKKQVENTLNGLVHFRNRVMHPTNIILSDDIGVDKVLDYVERTMDLLARWAD